MFIDLLIKLGLVKKKEKPIKVKYHMESWRIGYGRDGRVWVTGWSRGKYVVSNYIKRVEKGIITDVLGNTFSLAEADVGEWSYSLRIKFPSVYEKLKKAGIPLQLT